MEVSTFSLGITAITNALKLVKEVAGGAINVATIEAVSAAQEKLLEIQGAYLDCQLQLSSLISKNRELDDALAKMAETLAKQEDWNREAARYAPYEPLPGVLVMRFRKEELDSPDPLHYLCFDCFTKKQKMVLQAQPGYTTRDCNQCKARYFFDRQAPLPGRAFPRKERSLDG